MTDPTSRVLNVATSPRNQMDVAVKDGLSGTFSKIRTDIESINQRVVGPHAFAHLVQQFVAGQQFFDGQ